MKTNPSRKRFTLRRLGLASLGLFALSACLQTDPVAPGGDVERPPEDDGRRAGATSSTNWPAEFGFDLHLASWSFDSVLRIEFMDRSSDFPPVQALVEQSGSIYIYPARGIPALITLPNIQVPFQGAQQVEIPVDKLLEANPGASDTVRFNLRLDLDSIHGWFLGFTFLKSSGKMLESIDSPLPEKTISPKQARFFFQGLGSEVTSLLPEASGSNPEISFYIPGTPNFCRAQADSFHIGPLPNREYPLRVVRTSNPEDPQGGTLVEIWELRVKGTGEDSKFTLGDLVLDLRTKGKLTLRNED